MEVRLVPLRRLLQEVGGYPQFSVEPYRYCASPSQEQDYCPGSAEVEAYLLCSGGVCVALHFIGGDDGNLVIDAGSPEDVDRVLGGLLSSPSLTEHEAEALARLFFVGKDDVRRAAYVNWLGGVVRGRRVAVIRGYAYVLDGGVRAVGEADPALIRELGGVLVRSPASELASIILREAKPDFYALGRGAVLFCNAGRRCLCYPVAEVVDVVARKLSLEERTPERWARRGRRWLVWFGGVRYVSECPPRRRGGGGAGEEEEALRPGCVAGQARG